MKRNLILLCTWLCMSMAAHAVLVWDGTSAPWTNGSGTEADPYLIETPQQLSYLAELTSAGVSDYKGKCFLQTQDFDMKSLVFTQIGISERNPFSGNYNGNNKFISNLRIDGSALFGYAKGATIENVIVRDSLSFTKNFAVAGIVSKGDNVNLSNCKNMANLYYSNGPYVVGGIMAQAKGTCSLKNCVNEGSVRGTALSVMVGGILGYYGGSDTCILSNCSNTGSISNFYGQGFSRNSANFGGIVGYNASCAVLNDCSNTGSISSSSSSLQLFYLGGIVGFNKYCTMVNCFNMGSVIFSSSSASSSSSSSSYCAYSGGIVGYNESCTLTFCYNTGAVVSSSSTSVIPYSGGIVAGDSSSTALVIKNCYARCTVTSTATSTNSSYAFGIADAGTIQNSYFVGTVEGKSTYSILGGRGEVINCYHNSDCGANSGRGTAKTKAQLKSASMPVILNNSQAEPVWVMDTDNSNDGYPIFGWQAAPSYQITGTCDAKQGVVSGSGKYATGTVVQLTASPSDGYAFVSWSDGDTTNPRSITVGTADATYTALFVKIHYTITIGQDCSTIVQ